MSLSVTANSMDRRVGLLILLVWGLTQIQAQNETDGFLSVTTLDDHPTTSGELPSEPEKEADSSSRQPSPPNIIFIMVDDLGWNDVGYHGSEIRTPNIDGLANNGVKLENYYTAPVCGPTRAQFLSGKYSIHMGTHRGNTIACQPTGLPTQYPTIADKLKEKGYANHLIGKWHAGFHTVGHLPTERGFDTFRGFLLGHGDHFTHTRRYNGKEYLDYYNNTTSYNQSWGEYSTEAFTDRAKEIIQQSVGSSQPMFMFLSYQAPHNPLQVPTQYLSGYEDISLANRRRYAGMVTAIDQGVGEVVQSLKDAGMYDNSVIIFSTDNGGDVGSAGSNYPLRGNKGSLYEGGIRALGFVSSPLIDRPRRSVTDLMHVTDWLPTFLHIAGGSLNATELIDGINQWNTISKAEVSSRKEILHNIMLRGQQQRKATSPSRSAFRSNNIRTVASMVYGPWKILTGRQARNIIYPNPNVHPRLWRMLLRFRPRSKGDIQLFNLAEDPGESINLAKRKPAMTSLLLSKLRFYERSIAAPVGGSHNSQCDPELRGGIWGPFL